MCRAPEHLSALALGVDGDGVGPSGSLVRAKLAGAPTPAADASTPYVPASPLARAGTLAAPPALVTAVKAGVSNCPRSPAR